MIQFGESTLRLSTIARNSGHTAAAINELWPLISTLEHRARQSHSGPSLISLLARARLAFGVYLGDILPSNNLQLSCTWTSRALELTSHLSDQSLHSQALQSHGNELRKAGKLVEAVKCLSHSAELADVNRKSTILIKLARAAAETGSEGLFNSAVHDAQNLLSEVPSTPLFNSHIVTEVNLRGLLKLDRFNDAAACLPAALESASGSAPQWQTIATITAAEAHHRLGDTATARSLLSMALEAATDFRLPQQLQRAISIAKETGESEDLIATGHASLSKLSNTTI